MDLPPPGDIAIVAAGALAAGFVNGLSGTGYALVALGFWLQAMSPLTAAPLTALCGVAGHVQSLPTIWKGVRWQRLWPMLAAGIVGVLLPGIVKRDFAKHAGTMTGVYTMALCLGAAMAAGTSVPLSEPA